LEKKITAKASARKIAPRRIRINDYDSLRVFSPKTPPIWEKSPQKVARENIKCCCKNKDAAADDSGSFAYEHPKLLGFGKRSITAKNKIKCQKN
jgi:hypothetical protein